MTSEVDSRRLRVRDIVRGTAQLCPKTDHPARRHRGRRRLPFHQKIYVTTLTATRCRRHRGLLPRFRRPKILMPRRLLRSRAMLLRHHRHTHHLRLRHSPMRPRRSLTDSRGRRLTGTQGLRQGRGMRPGTTRRRRMDHRVARTMALRRRRQKIPGRKSAGTSLSVSPFAQSSLWLYSATRRSPSTSTRPRRTVQLIRPTRPSLVTDLTAGR